MPEGRLEYPVNVLILTDHSPSYIVCIYMYCKVSDCRICLSCEEVILPQATIAVNHVPTHIISPNMCYGYCLRDNDNKEII